MRMKTAVICASILLALVSLGARRFRGLVPLLEVVPSSVTLPVPTDGIRACLTGLEEGYVVTIAIPWVSNDGVHVSRLSDTQDVDATGTACSHAPPPGETIRLVPGTYTVISRIHSSRTADDGAPGPTATLTVLP